MFGAPLYAGCLRGDRTRPSARLLNSSATVRARRWYAPWHVVREEGAMAVILGTGEFRYEVVDRWAKLPPGREFNADVAAVGVDAQDRVYAFNRGAHPVVVFDREGN